MKAIRFSGRVWKDGKFWLVVVPALDAMTQGKSRKDALRMIADYIDTATEGRVRVSVIDSDGEGIFVVSTNVAGMVALMLRRQREASGLTLAQVASRLGQKSPNAYARYEQGASVPTVEKLAELMAAINPEHQLELR